MAERQDAVREHESYRDAWQKWVAQRHDRMAAYVWQPMLLRAVAMCGCPKKIGDVGVGTGHQLEIASRYFEGAALVGCDSNPLFVDDARARVPQATIVEGSALLLPSVFKDSDVLLGASIAQLLSDDDLELFLDQLRLSLSSGGVAVLSVDSPRRMAEEAGVMLQDSTTALDTSWDRAPETSYLRGPDWYAERCRTRFQVKTFMSYFPDGKDAYLQLVLR